MNKVLSLLLITVVLASCDQNQTTGKTNEITGASFDSAYQPAIFTDAGRMEKIMQAFPIIDKIFKEVHRLTSHPLKGLAPLGFAYGRLGEKEKTLEIIKKLEQRKIEDPVAVIDGDLMMVWWSLRDFDQTFYYMKKCIGEEMGPFNYVLELPMMKGVEDDPRIKAMLDKVREKYNANNFPNE